MRPLPPGNIYRSMPSREKQRNTRKLFASLGGTTVEFFDFYIYATVAVIVFPKLLFRATDAIAATSASLPASEHVTRTETVRIAIENLPTPDETSPWQDIIDFRTDLSDKLWAFRRFMASLAKNTKSEAEVRDEIEWRLHEYSEAMRLNKLRAGTASLRQLSFLLRTCSSSTGARLRRRRLSEKAAT
jgi:hypothetical protein